MIVEMIAGMTGEMTAVLMTGGMIVEMIAVLMIVGMIAVLMIVEMIGETAVIVARLSVMTEVTASTILCLRLGAE